MLETEESAMLVCKQFVDVTNKLQIPFIFKASFDKANRSSIIAKRGMGLNKGLEVFTRIKSAFNIPITTDVHEPWQVAEVSPVVDIIQLPAFLARQTDLVVAIAESGNPVNIKKPQYMSPSQIVHVVNKIREIGNHRIMICERGTCFGYDNLVVDMLGFGVMKEATKNLPLIFDVTHSLQKRNGSDPVSGGRRQQLPQLMRAGVAVGIAGLFIEAHPEPDIAICDGPSALPLELIEPVLTQAKAIDDIVKSMPEINVN